MAIKSDIQLIVAKDLKQFDRYVSSKDIRNVVFVRTFEQIAGFVTDKPLIVLRGSDSDEIVRYWNDTDCYGVGVVYEDFD